MEITNEILQALHELHSSDIKTINLEGNYEIRVTYRMNPNNGSFSIMSSDSLEGAADHLRKFRVDSMPFNNEHKPYWRERGLKATIEKVVSICQRVEIEVQMSEADNTAQAKVAVDLVKKGLYYKDRNMILKGYAAAEDPVFDWDRSPPELFEEWEQIIDAANDFLLEN